ncbi:DNA binding protein [Aureococcus anophagefferens]|nr:DNA binding protein [Aureococcus anophagefferens]
MGAAESVPNPDHRTLRMMEFMQIGVKELGVFWKHFRKGDKEMLGVIQLDDFYALFHEKRSIFGDGLFDSRTSTLRSWILAKRLHHARGARAHGVLYHIVPPDEFTGNTRNALDLLEFHDDEKVDWREFNRLPSPRSSTRVRMQDTMIKMTMGQRWWDKKKRKLYDEKKRKTRIEYAQLHSDPVRPRRLPHERSDRAKARAGDGRHGGPIKWSAVASSSGTRNAKQCRERWHYQLNPEIKKGRWTAEEDALISALPHGEWRRRNAARRTDMAIKNRYHTLTKRKCSAAARGDAAAPKARRRGPRQRASAPPPEPRRRVAAGSPAGAAPGPRRAVAAAAARGGPRGRGAQRRARAGRPTARPADRNRRRLRRQGPARVVGRRGGRGGVARSTSSPELSALCDVAGVALDGGKGERPELLAGAAESVGGAACTPEPGAKGEHGPGGSRGNADRSATISAISALSALSRATRLTPIAPCGGPRGTQIFNPTSMCA